MKLMKIVMLGIAGNLQDFLLAPSSLTAYLNSFDKIKENCSIINIDERLILKDRLQTECLRIATQINLINPKILALSAYCWNIEAIRVICRHVNKEVNVIVGGPEIDREDIESGLYRDDNFSHLVIGEGEIPLKLLVESYLNMDFDNIKSIPRIATKKDHIYEFSFFQSPNDGVIKDMDSLISPYSEGVVNFANYDVNSVTFNIETQRGCNLRCAYCLYHANFPSIKYRSPKKVLDEIEYIYAHGGRHLRITDANFFSDKNFAVAILSGLVARFIRMSIFIEVIPIFVDCQISELLLKYQSISKSNSITIGLGIQSINEKSLKAIRRNISVKHFDRAFNFLSKGEIVIKSDIILGLPYENKESWFELMDFVCAKMRYSKNSLQLALLRLLPGTELKEFRSKYNLTEDFSRPTDHFVYETPDMKRRDFVECLKISAMAYRIFHVFSDIHSIYIRNYFFDLCDKLGFTSVQLLQLLVAKSIVYLNNHQSGSRYCDSDFPDAEHYWEYEIFKEINFHVLEKLLDACDES